MTTELMKLAKAWRTAANRLDNYRSRPDSGFNSTAVDFEYEALAGVAAESMCAYVTRLQAQVAELQALSVTQILLTVVPGEDGMGEEVYAKSVADVEDLLSKLSEKADDADALRAQVDALAEALKQANCGLVTVLDEILGVQRRRKPDETGWYSDSLHHDQMRAVTMAHEAADAALAKVGR